MFKVAARASFRRRVVVKVPSDTGDREESFTATFRVLRISEIERHDLATARGTHDLLVAAIESLGEIEGADGQELPYSEDVRDLVLDQPHARAALVRAYFEGFGEARTGN